MSDKVRIGQEEWEVLDHKAVPGFRPAFYIIFSIAAVYFLYIFVTHFMGHSGGH